MCVKIYKYKHTNTYLYLSMSISKPINTYLYLYLYLFLDRKIYLRTHVCRWRPTIYIYIYIYIQYLSLISISKPMLGGWVNPHREQQTIPQGQTSIPPKSFSTPTANGQSAPRPGSARGVGRGAGNHTPSTASEISIFIYLPACAHLPLARHRPSAGHSCQYRLPAGVPLYTYIQYMYIHIYIHTHTYLSLSLYLYYISISTDSPACARHPCRYRLPPASQCIYIYNICIYIYIYIYICIYVYVYIHIYIYIYIYIYDRFLSIDSPAWLTQLASHRSR